MRIALVSQWMIQGGVEVFILRLAKYLSSQSDNDVSIITTVKKGRLFNHCEALGISCEFIAGFDWSIPVLYANKVASHLINGKYDVILLNHDRFSQSILARLPDNVAVIPVIHNDHPSVYRVGCANEKCWNVAIAVSPKTRNIVQDLLVDRKVICIPNGVDIPSVDAFSKRQSFSSPLQLLYVGRLEHRHKGVLYIPDILHQCITLGIDFSMTIVGDGEDKQLLQRELAIVGVLDRVDFRGLLLQDQVYQLMLSSHILLMPSHYEGLPLVLSESQACGCVPIASLLPGISDFVITNNEDGFLIGIGDTTGFADTIYKLSKDADTWYQMSQASYNNAKLRFSIEVMGEAYSQLFIRVLNGEYPLSQSRNAFPYLDYNAFTSRDYSFEFLRKIELLFRNKYNSKKMPRKI